MQSRTTSDFWDDGRETKAEGPQQEFGKLKKAIVGSGGDVGTGKKFLAIIRRK